MLSDYKCGEVQTFEEAGKLWMYCDDHMRASGA